MKTIKHFNSATRAFYVLPGKNSGRIPRRAQLLSVGYDEQERVAVSFAVNPEDEKTEERTFYLVAQGEHIPVEAGNVLYAGSARLPGRQEWHVFEIDSPEDKPRVTVSNSVRGDVHGMNVMVGSIAGGMHRPSMVTRPDGGVYIQ